MTYGPGNDLIPPDELEELEEYVESSAMPDTCWILRSAPAGTRDPFNRPITGYIRDEDGNNRPIEYPCRIVTMTPREVGQRGQIQLASTGARMPLDTQISATDRIVYVKKFGRPVDPVEYEITGGPTAGSLEWQMTISRPNNTQET